ncbi:MAG TPA: molybdenum cofactor guanylyltransferase [Puia sp.]|nr:molybdenum cofactor guanylyltransferase [Puia sp.]
MKARDELPAVPGGGVPGLPGGGAAGALLGVVLCGGESRRMGRDKGLISRDGRPWALLMGDKLAEHGLPVIYSINERQLPAYSHLVPAGRLVIDAGAWPGPLNGLFTVHRRFPAHDLLLAPCDMPDLEAATIGRVITAYREDKAADFVAYEHRGFLQPFCSIYTGAALAAAVQRPQDGSLRGLLRQGRIHLLTLPETETFRNLNRL